MPRFLRFFRKLTIALVVLIPVLGALAFWWYRSHYALSPEIATRLAVARGLQAEPAEAAFSVTIVDALGRRFEGTLATELARRGAAFATLARALPAGAAGDLPADRLWRMVDRVDAPAARGMIRELSLLQEYALRYPEARHQVSRSPISVLISDADVFELGSSTDGPAVAWRGVLEGISEDERLAERARHLWTGGCLVLEGPRARLEALCRWDDAHSIALKKPWNPRWKLPQPPGDPVAYRTFSYLEFEAFHFAEARTQIALLQAYLALRACRLESGEYPASLLALPIDPFSPTRAPLRYRRISPDRMLLYSVGPDGDDDGGRPISDSHGTPLRPISFSGTGGDFVARLNTL